MKKRYNLVVLLALVALLAPGAGAQGVGNLSVDQLRGHVTVLLFGGLVDPQSPEELPLLQRLANRYDGRGVEVVWVSVDPSSVSDGELTAYAAKYGFRGRVLRDTSGSVLRTYSPGKRPQLPTIVVLDPSGTVAGRPMGGFDRDADLVNKIAAIVDPLL
jgi:hypothetical protein